MSRKHYREAQERKKEIVLRKLVDEFSEVGGSGGKRRHLLLLAAELIEVIKSFYIHDDISRIAPGKRDVATVRNKDGKENYESGTCTCI